MFHTPRPLMLLTTLVSGSLHAFSAAVTYELEWSGADYGNTAHAHALLTMDPASLPNPGLYSGPASGMGISAFSMTITGATTGNGTFELADFAGFLWNSGFYGTETLDLDIAFDDLFVVGAGRPWLSPGDRLAGDFNFYGIHPNSDAPRAFREFVIFTSGTDGNLLELVSFEPQLATVPEAGTWAAGAVLTGLGAWSYRRGAMAARSR